jgi:hypothetical protein
MKDNPLFVLGTGIGLGAVAVWAAVEFFPFLLIGGGIYLAMKGLEKDQKTKEKQEYDTLD